MNQLGYTILYLSLSAFASWWISTLLVSERGPVGLFKKLRSLFGVSKDEDGESVVRPVPKDARYLRWFLAKIRYEIGLLLTCVKCLSLYVTALPAWLSAADFSAGELPFYHPAFIFAFCLYWFSLSAFVVTIDRIHGLLISWWDLLEVQAAHYQLLCEDAAIRQAALQEEIAMMEIEQDMQAREVNQDEQP